MNKRTIAHVGGAYKRESPDSDGRQPGAFLQLFVAQAFSAAEKLGRKSAQLAEHLQRLGESF